MRAARRCRREPVSLGHRVLIALAPSVGGAWVRARQRRYRRLGRALAPIQQEALGPYFEAPLLERVRVAIVDRIEPPMITGLARVLGAGALVDLSTVRAMAFGESIVVAGKPPGMPLLFHELIHVVQYDLFGIGPMLRRYLADWAVAGGDVMGIAAERCAYELQERFEREPGRPFNVANEVRRIMGAEIKTKGRWP